VFQAQITLYDSKDFNQVIIMMPSRASVVDIVLQERLNNPKINASGLPVAI
jgi:hypothetical protein